LHVSDLELPAGAKALTDSAIPVVSCLAPVEVSDEEAAPAEGEPEVIGRKKTDDEDAEPAKK